MIEATLTVKYYLNYVDGRLTTRSKQDPRTEFCTIEYLVEKVREGSKENLATLIEQQYHYDSEMKFASFSGICRSDDDIIEICESQEALDVESYDDGLVIWGLDEMLDVDLSR